MDIPNDVSRIFTVVTFTVVFGKTSADWGILYAIPASSNHRSFCISFYSQLSPLPQKREDVPARPLLDLTPWSACDPPPEDDNPVTQQTMSGKIVLVSGENCSMVDKARIVQDRKAAGVLAVSSAEIALYSLPNDTDYSNIKITAAAVSARSARILQKLMSSGEEVLVQQYAPEDTSRMDYANIVIFLMAVFSLSAGSYWSGITRYELAKRAMQPKAVGAGESDKAEYEEESSLNVSTPLVCLFVLTMCTMLLLLYFFYTYLVYVIIAIFCVAASFALFFCLEPLIMRIPTKQRLIPVPLSHLLCCPSGKAEIRQIILAMLCAGLAIWWFISRKLWYSWIIQDILGIGFCINMLRVIRMSNLKICTILLVLLFFYDIFFVFITPLITSSRDDPPITDLFKSGESVMVEVATGGNSDEQLPMVLKVPHLGYDPMSVCFEQYSLLGFGDVLVPGLLVSYCHGFDLEIGGKKVYYIAGVLAYCVGLILTFLGLFLMTSAQPALLYLVPCTVLTVIAISCCRGQFTHIWNGYSQDDLGLSDQDEGEGEEIEDEGSYQDGGVGAEGDITGHNTEHDSVTDRDKKSLIK